MKEEKECNQTEQKNSKQKIFEIVGIIICFILCIHFENNKVIVLINVLAILLIILTHFYRKKVFKETEEYLKNLPYDFNFEKEFSDYKKIGHKAKKNRTAKFSKYSEWKKYTEDRYQRQKEIDDFYRYLKQKLRFSKTEKECMLVIAVPAEFAIATLFSSIIETMEWISLCVGIFEYLIIVILLVNTVFDLQIKINFIMDLIEILFPNEFQKI